MVGVWRYAIYCGRFQPPHGGHLASVRYALSVAEVVCIGVRETARSIKDPLTVEEMVEAWRRLLEAEGLADRVVMRPVPDFDKGWGLPGEDKVVLKGHPLLDWARRVEEIFGSSPDRDVFVGNKPPMVLAFNLLGYPVIPGHRNAHRLINVSATELRAMILRGDPRWMGVLPKPVAEYLAELGIERRLRELARLP